MGVFDVTARKSHQWAMVGLVLVGFVLGEPRGALPVALAGAIMLFGRFWWPADVIRQLVWRVAEPAGWLKRIEREEDHDTRRLARVLGGIVWLLSAGLILSGVALIGWLLAAAVGVMVVLDATIDFCALCFVVAHVDWLRLRLKHT